MAAQAYIFFLAGFETSSTTMSFALHELAADINIQNKVHEEIDRALESHGGLCYEAISKMEFLDRVIQGNRRFRMYQQRIFSIKFIFNVIPPINNSSVYNTDNVNL